MPTFAKFLETVPVVFAVEYKGLITRDGRTDFHWHVKMSLEGQRFKTPITRTFETPYYTGLGHCEREKGLPKRGIAREPMTLEIAKAILPYGSRVSVSDTEGFVYPQQPKTVDLLYSLQSDARLGEHLLFEDFASELVLDTDSRKAEKMWRKCQDTRGRLMRLFGEHFDLFMSCIEMEEDE